MYAGLGVSLMISTIIECSSTLHGGLICITFHLSIVTLPKFRLDNNSYLEKYCI